jgi:hypothetical protein
MVYVQSNKRLMILWMDSYRREVKVKFVYGVLIRRDFHSGPYDGMTAKMIMNSRGDPRPKVFLVRGKRIHTEFGSSWMLPCDHELSIKSRNPLTCCGSRNALEFHSRTARFSTKLTDYPYWRILSVSLCWCLDSTFKQTKTAFQVLSNSPFMITSPHFPTNRK